MTNLKVLSENLFKKANDKSLSKKERLQEIDNMIRWHLDDVFKLIKNINDTSVNETDRQDRLLYAESMYGIPKTHLI